LQKIWARLGNQIAIVSVYETLERSRSSDRITRVKRESETRTGGDARASIGPYPVEPLWIGRLIQCCGLFTSACFCCKGRLILTHGAGANCRTQLLVALAEAFAEAGMLVLRCDLPYRQVRHMGRLSPAARSAIAKGFAMRSSPCAISRMAGSFLAATRTVDGRRVCWLLPRRISSKVAATFLSAASSAEAAAVAHTAFSGTADACPVRTGDSRSVWFRGRVD